MFEYISYCPVKLNISSFFNLSSVCGFVIIRPALERRCLLLKSGPWKINLPANSEFKRWLFCYINGLHRDVRSYNITFGVSNFSSASFLIVLPQRFVKIRPAHNDSFLRCHAGGIFRAIIPLQQDGSGAAHRVKKRDIRIPFGYFQHSCSQYFI